VVPSYYAGSGWFRPVTWVSDGQPCGWLSGAVVSMLQSKNRHSQCAIGLNGLIYTVEPPDRLEVSISVFFYNLERE
jgi:hypothetical protein